MADTDAFGLEEAIAHGLPGFPGSLYTLASPSSGASEESRYLAALLAASLTDVRTAAAAGWTRASAAAFETSLRRIVRAATPSFADRAAREDVIARLTSLASTGINYHKGLEVQPYGSFVSGLYTPTGDLDLSLEGEAFDPVYRHQRRHVAMMGRPERQAFLRALGGRLEARGALNMLRLTHARVPIIKFVDHMTMIECDCAIDSAGAQFKSAAVGVAAGVDWRIGALVRLVKLWARAQGVNDSSTGTFNSFALTMLVFLHLQTRMPAVLPPLRDLLVGEGVDVDGDARPMHGGSKPDAQLLAGMVARATAWAPRAAANKETLAELVTSFFGLLRGLADAWCGGDEAQARVLRRIRVDTWGARLRLEPWDKPDGHYFCSIEDPFDTLDNCGRTVRDPRNAQAIREAATAAAAAAAEAANGGSFVAMEALFGTQIVQRAFGGLWDEEESTAPVPPTVMYIPRSLWGVLRGAPVATPLPPADHHKNRGISDGPIGIDIDLDLAEGVWPEVAAQVAAAAATLAAEEAESMAAEHAKREAQREKKQKKKEGRERARAEAKARRDAEMQQAQQAHDGPEGQGQGEQEPEAAVAVQTAEVRAVDLMLAASAAAIPAATAMKFDATVVAVAASPVSGGANKIRKPRNRRKPRENGEGSGGGVVAAVAPPLAPLPPLPPLPLPPPGLTNTFNYDALPSGPSLEGQGGSGGPAAGRGGGHRRRSRYRGRGRGREGDAGRQTTGN